MRYNENGAYSKYPCGMCKTRTVRLVDSIPLSDGVQLGVYGPGQNGGLKIGGRRNNWKENPDDDEIGVVQRFSTFTNSDLAEFEKAEQESHIDIRASSADANYIENFQITRLFDSQFWKELNEGAADRELSINELVQLVPLS